MSEENKPEDNDGELWKKFAPELNKTLTARLARERELIIKELKSQPQQAQSVEQVEPSAKDAENNSLKLRLEKLERDLQEKDQKVFQSEKNELIRKSLQTVGIEDEDAIEVFSAYLDKSLKFDKELSKHFFHNGTETMEIEDAIAKYIEPKSKKFQLAKPIKTQTGKQTKSDTTSKLVAQTKFVLENGKLVKK